MTSYRFRRRAFIGALSGGVGLKIMLRNLEGVAQGMRSPGRLLITHWPVGIVAGQNDALWKPTSGSVGGSPALKPFADAGLGPDMTVMRGLGSPTNLAPGGGGPEGGMVTVFTGVLSPGTRAGMVENDDSIAGGPSIDQILLQKVPALRSPGRGPSYANSAADTRTDWGEISAKHLSYSTEFDDVPALSGTVRGARPLLPAVSPIAQFTALFADFVPGTAGAGGSPGGAGGAGGGGRPAVADAILKKLVGRRSVLDFTIEELNRLKRLAPGEARNRLEIHTDAVVAAEASVTNAINANYRDPGGGGAGGGGTAGSGGAGAGGGAGAACGACAKQPSPSPDIVGVADPARGVGNSFNNPVAKQDDAPLHALVGNAHLDVLKAAFICDLIRVGTFQWASSSSHVGFALYPGSTQPYEHHPQSHKTYTADTTASETLAGLSATAQFLFNVHSWYFARHAENFASWKTAVDGCGNSLLDYTCVPFLTEVRAAGHERTNMPAMIIGGKKLGFLHDRYVTRTTTVGEFWATIAQAFGYTSTEAPFGAPIDGFWASP